MEVYSIQIEYSHSAKWLNWNGKIRELHEIGLRIGYFALYVIHHLIIAYRVAGMTSDNMHDSLSLVAVVWNGLSRRSAKLATWNVQEFKKKEYQRSTLLQLLLDARYLASFTHQKCKHRHAMRNDLTFSCRISQNKPKKKYREFSRAEFWPFLALCVCALWFSFVRFRLNWILCDCQAEWWEFHRMHTQWARWASIPRNMLIWLCGSYGCVAVMALWTQRRNPTRFMFWQRSGTTLSHHSHRCMLPVSAAQHNATT